MKKKLFFLSITASFILLITSCKKDDTTPAGPDVTGFWIGNLGIDANNLDTECSVVFNSNGTARWYFGNNADTANAIQANGTYTTVSPYTAKGSYTFANNTQQSFSASLTNNLAKMTGSMGADANVDGVAFFEVDKQ
jgi:hypothetical protein